MNIVLITTGQRTDLLSQSIESLMSNSVYPLEHELVIVHDRFKDGDSPRWKATEIFNRIPAGASASRNIGASSIPGYRRQEHVMFIDDDVYFCPGWDTRLKDTLAALSGAVVSGHAHPFNHSIDRYVLVRPNHEAIPVESAGVLSTVHLSMSWSIWDDVGYFVEPGGPGGSEDVDWCSRATKKGYGLAVTDPHCVIHCGLTSSGGQKIVGYDLMVKQNLRLIHDYELGGQKIVQL